MTIPQYGGAIAINGHQSKIIVTDFHFGSQTLLYSTAEVLSFGQFDDKEVLALWLPEGEPGEFMIKGQTEAKLPAETGFEGFDIQTVGGNIAVSYTQEKGFIVVEFDSCSVVLLDRSAAYLFWVPTLSQNPLTPVDDTGMYSVYITAILDTPTKRNRKADIPVVLVQGPYLVRDASYDEESKHLDVYGDLDKDTTITIWGPSNLCSISWNSEKAAIVSKHGNQYVIEVEGPPEVEIPALGPWKYTDALPEIASDYETSSSTWIGKFV